MSLANKSQLITVL